MRIPKLIWDNGTPACLPDWACDEIANLRLENLRLKEQNLRLLRESGSELPGILKIVEQSFSPDIPDA